MASQAPALLTLANRPEAVRGERLLVVGAWLATPTCPRHFPAFPAMLPPYDKPATLYL